MLLIYSINQMEGNSYILLTVYEPHIYISLHDYCSSSVSRLSPLMIIHPTVWQSCICITIGVWC